MPRDSESKLQEPIGFDPQEIPQDRNGQKHFLVYHIIEPLLRATDPNDQTTRIPHKFRLMREAFYRYCVFIEQFGEMPFTLNALRQWEIDEGESEEVVSRRFAHFPVPPNDTRGLCEDWQKRTQIERVRMNAESRVAKRAASNPFETFLGHEAYGSEHEGLDDAPCARRYRIGGLEGRTFCDIIDAKDMASSLASHAPMPRGGAGSRADSDVAQQLFRTRDVEAVGGVSEVYGFQKELKVVRTDVIEAIGGLAARFPNMAPVVDWLLDVVSLNLMTLHPYINFPPILLDGPPGVGKTAFVRALSRALGLHAEFMDCSMLQAPFELFGSHPTWGGAVEGRITGAAARSPDANMIFMLDEFDKMPASGSHPVQPAFTSVLEPTTANAVKDGFLGVGFNLSHVNWICTSNEVEAIHRFLLSRLKVFNIPAPSDEQMPNIIRSVWQDLRDANRTTWGYRFSERLDERFVQAFLHTGVTPRAIRKMLQHACARQARQCFANNQRIDEPQELDPSLLSIDGNEGFAKERGIGFLA